MLEFVYGHDEAVTQFVAAFGSIGGGDVGRCKTIGVVDGSTLIAGMIYFKHDPDAATMEFGVASSDRRWLSRAVYRRMFEYPFIECECQMLKAHVRADAEQTLSILARMNFNLMPVPRLYGREEHGMLCTLTDDQWLDGRIARRLYRNVRNKEAA